MSAYEELLEKVDGEVREFDPEWGGSRDSAERILAIVRRTLETVTPEMAVAEPDEYGETWLAMLHASPLTPP